MMKRFFSMIAVLAISLLAACAQVPSNCKNCPPGADCCGACPCGVVSDEQASGKMCDPSKMKAKHHGKRHHKAAAAAPASATATTKDAKAAATIPNQEKDKNGGMFDGVKKIIQDVQSKDAAKDAVKDVKKPH